MSQLKVTTGRRAGERIEIISGISDTQTIVANGAGFLKDGDLVGIVDAASPKIQALAGISSQKAVSTPAK